MKKFDKFKAHGLIIEDIKAQVSIEEDDSVTIKFVGFMTVLIAQINNLIFYIKKLKTLIEKIE